MVRTCIGLRERQMLFVPVYFEWGQIVAYGNHVSLEMLAVQDGSLTLIYTHYRGADILLHQSKIDVRTGNAILIASSPAGPMATQECLDDFMRDLGIREREIAPRIVHYQSRCWQQRLERYLGA